MGLGGAAETAGPAAAEPPSGSPFRVSKSVS